MRIVLDENAIMPVREHATDAGIDLMTPVDVVVPAHGFTFVDTGVHVEIPVGTCGRICSKSGLNRYRGITADGVVDQGYTGTVGVTLHNDGDEDCRFPRGRKIAQLVIEKVFYEELEVVSQIVAGDRGNDGYGSTGE